MSTRSPFADQHDDGARIFRRSASRVVRQLTLSLALVMLALACIDCSDSTGGTSPGTGGSLGNAALVKACEDLVEAYCNRMEACYPAYFQNPLMGQSCRKSNVADCHALAYPWVSYPPDAAATVDACTQQVKAISCPDLQRAGGKVSCDKELEGEPALPNGAACLESDHCISGECRRPDGSNKKGTCGVCEKGAALGEKCVPEKPGVGEKTCDAGLVCVGGKCEHQIISGVGGPCDYVNPDCEKGLACHSGTCVAPPKKGKNGEACDVVSCEDGLECKDKVCVQGPSSLVEGESCDPTHDQCYTGFFSFSFRCDLQSKTCVPYEVVGEGMPCGNGVTICDFGFECDWTAHSCVVKNSGKTGDPCTPDGKWSCKDGRPCENGLCGEMAITCSSPAGTGGGSGP